MVVRAGRRFARLRRLAWVGVAGLVCAGGWWLVGIPSALSAPGGPPTKVTICHSTSSKTNPYVSEDPAIANNGDLHGGHLDHKGGVFPEDDWGDIIPPYEYVDADGVTQTFIGYNWSPEGQAIWEHGCKAGSTPGAELKPLTPLVTCVEETDSGGFVAHFGYTNPNPDDVLAPYPNAFTSGAEDRGQPTVFPPGTVHDRFQVASPDGSALSWMLTGNQVTASAGSPACQGTIAIVKALLPRDDPGRFNLEIDGAAAGGAVGVGDGGSTGSVAVKAGRHTAGESAAAGTKLADYLSQIVCTSGGTVVAEANAGSVSLRVGKGENVTCTITNTARERPSPLLPKLECVVFRGDTPDQAVWGYENDSGYPVTVKVGPTNSFAPGLPSQGQPTVFQPGRWTGVFQTPFDGAVTLTWTLGGQAETASSASTPCTAVVQLRKVTAPTADPGLFHFSLNDQVVATGGGGTDAGPFTVGVGEATFSESAASGTDLSNYESTIDCTRNGAPALSVTGTTVDVPVGNGDFVVCTFVNVRKTTPETPTPPTPPTPVRPPEQPDPPPDQPAQPPSPTPTPPNQRVDLEITKTVQPSTVRLGGKLTWVVTVKNVSGIDAHNVDVVKINEVSYRAKLLSLTPSQGTCSKTTCSLGPIAAGQSATITAVAMATKTGLILNVVRVGSEENEADYVNNTASAEAHVIGPFRPEPSNPGCRTLTAAPHMLRVGTSSIVLATATNRFGAPVPGVTVHLQTARLNRAAKTSKAGVAHFTLTPTTSGLVSFRGTQHVASQSSPAGSVCHVVLGAVHAISTPPVTG